MTPLCNSQYASLGTSHSTKEQAKRLRHDPSQQKIEALRPLKRIRTSQEDSEREAKKFKTNELPFQYNRRQESAKQIGDRVKSVDNFAKTANPFPLCKDCFEINQALCIAKGPHELEQICKNYINDFNCVNFATTLTRLAKLRGKPDNNLLHVLIKGTLNKISGFNSLEIANITWACAKLGIHHDKLFNALAEEAIGKIKNFNSQNIAKIAWACAKLGIPHERLFQALANEVLAKIKNFNSQEIANTAWAFAKLSIPHERLFQALANEALAKIKRFNSQEIANTAWAFAKLGIPHERLFQALANEVLAKIKNFNSQEIGNIIWAFAKLGIPHERLFHALANEALAKIKSFNSQDLANIAWAFATLNIHHIELLRELANEALGKSLNSQDIANTAWAFASLSIHHTPLFHALANKALGKMRNFTPQEMANTAWAFAKLAIHHNPLFHALANEALSKIKSFNSHDLASIAWAFAANGQIIPESFLKALALTKEGSLSNEVIHDQLKYALLHIYYEQPKLQLPWMHAFLEKIKTIQLPITHPSQLHLDCSKMMKLMQIPHTNEKWIQGISTDIVINDTNIIIEIDGPSHFAYQSHDPLGHTLFKRRLLASMGWHVIPIPYWEWNRCKSETDKKEYMQRLLKEVKYDLEFIPK